MEEPDVHKLFPSLAHKDSNITILSQEEYDTGSSCGSAGEFDERVYYAKNFTFPTDLLLPRGPLQIFAEEVVMGDMGSVKLGWFREKHKVSIKSFTVDEWSNETRLQVFDELNMIKHLGSSPWILSCYGYVNNGSLVQLVYELPPYGSLDQILRESKIAAFPLCLIICWLNDLAEAMQFLHSKGIVHGDIRTENVLVFERLELKLCNFHLAKPVSLGEGGQSQVLRSVIGGSEMGMGGAGGLGGLGSRSRSGHLGMGTVGSKSSLNLSKLNKSLAENSSAALASFLNEESQRGVRSFQRDKIRFFDAAVEILARKSVAELVQENDNYSLAEKDRILADLMISFSVTDYSFTSRLYNMLLTILAPPPPHYAVTAKEISNQLTSLLEDAYEEDPRSIMDSMSSGSGPAPSMAALMAANPQYEPIARLENFILTQTRHHYHFPDLPQGYGANFAASSSSNARQNSLKSLLSKVQQGSQSASQSSRAGNLGARGNRDLFPRIEMIVDHRQRLIDWLMVECEAPSHAEAEDLACNLVQLGVHTPQALRQRLAANPSFLAGLKIADPNFSWNIRHRFDR